jgi:hypothetical protein
MLHDVEGLVLTDEVERLRAERDAALAREDAVGWQVDALRRRLEDSQTALLAVRVALQTFDVVPGDAGDVAALKESVRAAITAIESGAIFDWYQRDALLRRLRDHVEEGSHAGKS